MIIFKSISTFRIRLKEMLSVRKGVYSSVPEEIKREFESSDIEKIRNNRDMILIQDEAIIVKLRLPDKRLQLSKANGYRLVYMVSTIHERVVFLDIYPKRGPLQRLDISEKDLLRLLTEFISENEKGILEEYKF